MSGVPSRREKVAPSDSRDNGPGTSLTVKIQNTRPVELLDISAGLLAVAEQFRAIVRRRASPSSC